MDQLDLAWAALPDEAPDHCSDVIGEVLEYRARGIIVFRDPAGIIRWTHRRFVTVGPLPGVPLGDVPEGDDVCFSYRDEHGDAVLVEGKRGALEHPWGIPVRYGLDLWHLAADDRVQVLTERDVNDPYADRYWYDRQGVLSFNRHEYDHLPDTRPASADGAP